MGSRWPAATICDEPDPPPYLLLSSFFSLLPTPLTLADFEALVQRLKGEIPADYLRGVADITVSPRAVPHPESPDVFTMGECVPLLVVMEDDDDADSSRIVLYHGSFAALAQLNPEFDWEDEAWETLTHELRHHLERRAGEYGLETYDWAADQNFARRDGESFDPGFYLDGERLAPEVYHVEGDVFIDRRVANLRHEVEFEWQGRTYRVTPPPDMTLPAFLTIVHADAKAEDGDLILVLRRRPGLRSLLKPSEPYEVSVEAESRG